MRILASGAIRTEGIVTDIVSFDGFDFARALENLHDSSQIKTVFEPGR